MSEIRCIAVFGATGAQGGAVVTALLEDGSYTVRALTRDPASDAAEALTARGCHEVVAADLDDVPSLTKALEGCYGVFVVTNYWADMDTIHEMTQTENASVACKAAGVTHVVLSTLEDTREFITEKDEFPKLDDGKYYVPHFDGKGEAAVKFAEEVPTTLLYTSFYYENFIAFGMGPKKMEDADGYAITMPMGDKKLLMNAVVDIGKMALVAFNDASTINTNLYVASTAMTLTEIAAAFSKIMDGADVKYQAVTPAQFAAFGFPGADDLANMFHFFADFEEYFLETRDPVQVATKFEVLAFETWLEDNKDAFASA